MKQCTETINPALDAEHAERMLVLDSQLANFVFGYVRIRGRKNITEVVSVFETGSGKLGPGQSQVGVVCKSNQELLKAEQG